MTKPPSLAVFGAPSLFDRPIEKGQHFFPKWAQYEALFKDIFERQYYTNHGPLIQQLEVRLAERLAVRHAMCVTNEFIGLVLAGQALCVQDNVVVPAHSSIATSQSLHWTDAQPLLCDVDPDTGLMTAEMVEPLFARHSVSAILAVNPWGDACDVDGLQALADQNGVPLYFDSSHAFGCAIGGRPVGTFGAVEVMSFHSDNVLGACEGGVICTQNDELAGHIRNIRSSYGMGPPLPVLKTGNARMSEAQAAVALFNLDHYPEYQQRNDRLFGMLRIGLAGVAGLEVRVPTGVSQSNYQNLICLVNEKIFGLRRDDLWQILRAENLLVGKGFHPPMHHTLPTLCAARPTSLPNTERYCARTIELSMNQALSESDAARLIDLLGAIQHNAEVIRRGLAEVA